ncbi:unnamed protein product, partial [marine sediment metagenome]
DDGGLIASVSGMAWGTGDFTLISWYYVEDYTNPNSETAVRSIAADTPEHNGGWGLGFITDDNATPANRRKGYIYCRNAASASKLAFTAALTKQTWYMVAGKRVGTDLFISLNGAAFSAGETDADMNFSGVDALGIGRDGNADTLHFYGKKGEDWIYNRELSTLEIQNIYLATKWRYR